jgi:Ca2+-binding EF-hand superfamily protein
MWIFSVAVMFLLVSGMSSSNAENDLFNSMDRNSDGRINEEEFSKDMKEYVFDKLDHDNTETISRDEWMSILGTETAENHGELFQRIDRDKDRRITFFEFADYADDNSNIEKAFINLDRDGSNSLSPDEVTARPLFRMVTVRIN